MTDTQTRTTHGVSRMTDTQTHTTHGVSRMTDTQTQTSTPTINPPAINQHQAANQAHDKQIKQRIN